MNSVISGRDGRPRVADDRTRTETALDQVGVKTSHAEDCVIAIAATIGRGTVTPSKVTTKSVDSCRVQIHQRFVPSLQEHAYVGRGS